MEIPRANKPIFIVGCTRSGTKLVARLLGGHPDNFLITEHREKFHIPEDRSGVCEEFFGGIILPLPGGAATDKIIAEKVRSHLQTR